MPSEVRVGTRKSPLARAQTGLAMAAMRGVGLAPLEVLVTSHGDVDRVNPLHKLGAPGAFTRALEDALAAREIDIAVHSLKDLPLRPRFPVVAILPRNDPRDVLLLREDAHAPDLGPLPMKPGARVGTSAPRRQTQLAEADPDAIPTDLRGNVDTRLKFLAAGGADAILMAAAAFERMDLPLPEGVTSVPLDPHAFPVCPGQGALAVQARADAPFLDALRRLDDPDTRTAVEGERAVLAALGGGCGLPLGVTLERAEAGWRLSATLAHPEWERASSPRLRRLTLESPAPRALVRDAARALTAPWPASPEAPPAPAPALAGRTALLVMDPETAAPYVEALAAAGARAAAWPSTAHAHRDLSEVPLKVEVAYASASWVAVASPRGVPGALRLAALPRAGMPRHAAVGAGTARALRRAGLPCHLVSPDGTGAGLARALASASAPGIVVAPGASDPTPDFARILRASGFEVAEWPTYDTRALDPLPPAPFSLPVHALVLASPSAAHALARAVPDARALARRFVAFGPTTAEAMKDLGLPVDAMLPRRSPAGLLEVIA